MPKSAEVEHWFKSVRPVNIGASMSANTNHGEAGRPQAARARFTSYYNYHRLHAEIGWLHSAERFDGTPFTDRGFDNIPALAHLTGWLDDLRAAA